MNTMKFQDLVKGCHGRKIAYTDVEQITEDNIVKVIGDCIGVFYYNKTVIKYLWEYYKGDQPVLYRTKLSNEDITNKIVENHAYEWVQFKVGQTYGEPIQFVSRKDDEAVNKAVDELNDYLADANKHEKDIKAGEWQSATGTSFKAIQIVNGDVPIRVVAPNPLNTFVIYNRSSEEPILAVQELKDENGEWYKLCYTETHECKVKNSSIIADSWKLHGFGGIPIVEFPNNHERLSDIELVIDLLDAINNTQSNRMDGIEQFIQAWYKFVNCEVDEEQFKKMKMNHKFYVGDVVKPNKKADENYTITNTSGVREAIVTELRDYTMDIKIIKGSRSVGEVFTVEEKYFDLVRKAKQETIVIYRNDNKVVALDKTTGEKAEAKCNPADEFDFRTGAKLAFNRLMGEDAKPDDGEVKRKAKIGEYVKVVNAKPAIPSYKKSFNVNDEYLCCLGILNQCNCFVVNISVTIVVLFNSQNLVVIFCANG